MSVPKRIQLSRRKGWRKPEGAVVVARPTKWGNPFAVARPTTISEYPSVISMPILSGEVIPRNREEAVRLFRYAAERRFSSPRLPSFEEIRRELGGRDLACWCPLDQPCHADVLLEIANEEVS